MRDDYLASTPDRGVQPGEVITFGAYPQMAGGLDRAPIQWRALENSGGELFVLSEHILDCKRYHGEYTDVTWQDSDLRKWLSDEFYHAAFNAAEQELVRTTRCADNGEGSPDTEDRVFLLSVAEVKSLTGTLGQGFRRAAGTKFAQAKKSDGCHLYVYNLSVSANYITVNGQKQGCSWWWLRTQPGSLSRAAFVGTRASIRSYGRVSLPYYGVRPALKLALR